MTGLNDLASRLLKVKAGTFSGKIISSVTITTLAGRILMGDQLIIESGKKEQIKV